MTELESRYFSPSVWFSPRHLLSLTFQLSSSTSDITLQLSSLLPACFSTPVCNTEHHCALTSWSHVADTWQRGCHNLPILACHILFYFEMLCTSCLCSFCLLAHSDMFQLFVLFSSFSCVFFSAAAHRSLQPHHSCCCHCISCALCVKEFFDSCIVVLLGQILFIM